LKYSYTINVVIPIPIDGFFTYSLSKSEFFKIKIGSRVIVSFGKKKYYTAVVFEKHENYDVDYELKEISYLIDEPPCLTNEQITFINWLSDYYLSPTGVVLDAALPRSFLIKSESVLRKVYSDKVYNNENRGYEILRLFEKNEEILATPPKEDLYAERDVVTKEYLNSITDPAVRTQVREGIKIYKNPRYSKWKKNI